MKADIILRQASCSYCGCRHVEGRYSDTPEFQELAGGCALPPETGWASVPPGPEHTAFQLALDYRIESRRKSGFWCFHGHVYEGIAQLPDQKPVIAYELTNAQLAHHLACGGQVESLPGPACLDQASDG